MDRLKAIVERIRKSLIDDGFIDRKITKSSTSGPGDFSSYIDYLVEKRLEGKNEPTSMDTWEDFKAQLNERESTIRKAAEDYRKLESRYRGLKLDYELLIREVPKKDSKTESDS